jgi:hypothetical protein
VLGNDPCFPVVIQNIKAAKITAAANNTHMTETKQVAEILKINKK